MVSINTIAILFLFGAIAIGGALAFSRIQSFFSNFQLPSLGDISLPDIPSPFVGPERMDVAFPSPAREEAGLPPIDIVPDVTGGRGERLRNVIPQRLLDSIERFMEIPRQEPEIVPEFGRRDPRREAFEAPTPIAPTSLQEFPTFIAPETQAGFQERSQAFAETFPDIAFSTSLTPEITFGRQLSRESTDFQDVLDAEARRSEAIFANLFGNVQNPNF